MSMLNCFFSRQYAEKGTIFEGLSIWKQEKYRRLQGTYPVIFLSFADVKQNNYQDAVQKIKNIIVDAYRQHRYLEQEECFTQNEKQQMLEITEKMSNVTAQDAFQCDIQNKSISGTRCDDWNYPYFQRICFFGPQ